MVSIIVMERRIAGPTPLISLLLRVSLDIKAASSGQVLRVGRLRVM